MAEIHMAADYFVAELFPGLGVTITAARFNPFHGRLTLKKFSGRTFPMPGRWQFGMNSVTTYLNSPRRRRPPMIHRPRLTRGRPPHFPNSVSVALQGRLPGRLFVRF